MSTNRSETNSNPNSSTSCHQLQWFGDFLISWQGFTCEAKNQSVEKKGYPIRLTEFGQQDPEIFGRKCWNRGAAWTAALSYCKTWCHQTMGALWQILTRNHICFRTFGSNLALFQIWPSDIASTKWFNLLWHDQNIPRDILIMRNLLKPILFTVVHWLIV